MADTLKEYSPNHQSLEQLSAAAGQLAGVKDKLERQQQADAEKLQREQSGKEHSMHSCCHAACSIVTFYNYIGKFLLTYILYEHRLHNVI